MKEKLHKNFNKSLKSSAIWGAISLLLFVVLLSLTISFAYLSGKKEVQETVEIGQATIVSITNPTI